MSSEANPNDGVYLEHRRAVVVRLLSNGPKYRTKEGYIRDQREHDGDTFGIEYEVELVDIGNEPARFWLVGHNKCLEGFKTGDVVALGWKPMVSGYFIPTAWRVEDCYTPLS